MADSSLFAAIPPLTVVERLVALLPGLDAAATARFDERRRRTDAVWARAGREPLTDRLGPSPLHVLDVDLVWEYARAQGWQVDAHRIGAQIAAGDDDALARDVLGALATVPGDILLVNHDRRAYRVAAARLLEFVARPLACTGDVSFDGLDEIYVAADAPHIALVHHEQWAFDLRGPA